MSETVIWYDFDIDTRTAFMLSQIMRMRDWGTSVRIRPA